MRTVNFTYIIGGNIELNVVAEISPDEPDVNYVGVVDITEVSLASTGDQVEPDDIFIKCGRAGLCTLNDLLEEAAMDED